MALPENQLAVIAVEGQQDAVLRDRNAQDFFIGDPRRALPNRKHVAAGVPKRVDRLRRNILVSQQLSRHALPGRSFRPRGWTARKRTPPAGPRA